MRALTTWSWLIATTGTAVMLAPHVPLLAAQWAVQQVRGR